MADVGCRRNTVFGAEDQEASSHLQSWRDAGIVHFWLKFVHETEDEVIKINSGFKEALVGKRPFASLTRTLRKMTPQGTTEGSLYSEPK